MESITGPQPGAPAVELPGYSDAWIHGCRMHAISGFHRMESNARPDVVLPAGDNREIYVIMTWQGPEVLLIAEDGELLRKAADFDFKANFR